MASSDNMLSMEPWMFRHTFGDSSWFSDAFSRETETIAKALQNSFSTQVESDDFLSPPPVQTPTPTPTPTTTTVSGGSENENVVVSRRRNYKNSGGGGVGVAGGKVTKRKSRASKKTTTTTFITADPANFRQMVQQVTGVRLTGNGQLEVAAPLLKPEPQRLVNRLQKQQVVGGCLPTLDTSAFLLDPTHPHLVGPSAVFAQSSSPLTTAAPSTLVVAEGGGSGSGAAPTFDFDSFSSFPTLESWKAM